MFKENQKVQQEFNNSTNQIGKGTSLQGDLEAYGNIRIEGNIKGNIKTKSKVALGKSSIIDGNILAQNAEIEGEVKGRVEVSEVLILKPTAVVHGDIITNKLIVESGATFNGACQMGMAAKEIKISSDTKPMGIVNEPKAKTV